MTHPNPDPRPTDPNRMSAERGVDSENLHVEAMSGGSREEHVREDAERK
jgi:hypothetical protein